MNVNTIIFVLGIAIFVAVFLLAGSDLNLILFACTWISLIFVVALLVWQVVGHRRTSRYLQMLREEIKWNRRARERSRTAHMREVNQKERDE